MEMTKIQGGDFAYTESDNGFNLMFDFKKFWVEPAIMEDIKTELENDAGESINVDYLNMDYGVIRVSYNPMVQANIGKTSKDLAKEAIVSIAKYLKKTK